jgi:hypothetical protein
VEPGFFHEVVDELTGTAIGAGGRSLGSGPGLEKSLVAVRCAGVKDYEHVLLLVVHYMSSVQKESFLVNRSRS